jgi:hypothetical protein
MLPIYERELGSKEKHHIYFCNFGITFCVTPSVCPSICPSFIHPSTHPCVRLSVCLSVCLFLLPLLGAQGIHVMLCFTLVS